VFGEAGRDGEGRDGGGVGGETAFEAAAEGVVQEVVLDAQDEEGGRGDLAFDEGLLDGLDDFGGALALFGVHPGFAVGEVAEVHGGVSNYVVPYKTCTKCCISYGCVHVKGISIN
jgi:hypothetical protein